MTDPQHPPAPAPAPAADPKTPAAPDPEVVRRSLGAAFRFGLWMLLTVLLVGAPLPWGALALATTVVAAVMGVRALVAHRRARLRGGMTVALVVGLAMTAFLGMESVGRVVTWDIQTTLQECQAGAITVQAADRCESAYEKSLENFITDLGSTSS